MNPMLDARAPISVVVPCFDCADRIEGSAKIPQMQASCHKAVHGADGFSDDLTAMEPAATITRLKLRQQKPGADPAYLVAEISSWASPFLRRGRQATRATMP